MASAVVVNDTVYLVDCGLGATRQLKCFEWNTRGSPNVFEALRGVFFTHLHSDHVVDYPGLLLFGWISRIDGVEQPIQVYGPGRRGKVQPIFGKPAHPVPIVHPDNSTPSTVDMTTSLLEAFATDINDRMRSTHAKDVRSLFQIQDIRIPEGIVSDPDIDPAPSMEPFLVMQDEQVKVTATLVSHAPLFPAFAFRFDTSDGAIVFSGDTAPSPNLIRLAQGADILVHEAIDTQWVQWLLPDPQTLQEAALLHHLLSAHTSIEDTGRIATAAGVKTLVLSHLTPSGPQGPRWHEAGAYFSGQLVVGEDLLQIGIGKIIRKG
jgi:ribonuclease BN (tRNA processing enzyme)